MKQSRIAHDLLEAAIAAGKAKGGPPATRRQAALTSLKYACSQARTARMYTVYSVARKLLVSLSTGQTFQELLTLYAEAPGSDYLPADAKTEAPIISVASRRPVPDAVIPGTLCERSEPAVQQHLSASVMDALEGYV